MGNQMMKTNKQSGKRMSLLWISILGTLVLAAGILLTVWIVEKNSGSDDFAKGVPDDVYVAALKLQEAGYSVEIEQDNMLTLLTNEATEYYDITFSGTMTAYMQAYHPESMELKAEIFYFSNESDAKLLYEKMKENWKFTEEQGELRYHKNVVYMGVKEALEAFEK